MFIGYSTHQKGYKCYVPETRRVLVSRDVKFLESRGYYAERSWEDIKDLSQSASDRAHNLRVIMERLGISLPNPPAPAREVPPQAVEETVEEVVNTHPDPEGGNGSGEQPEQQAQPEDNSGPVHDQDETQPRSEDEAEAETEQVQPLRRSTRIRKPASNWINTRVYFNAEAVAHPYSGVCSLAQYPEEHQVFIGELDQEWVPKTYEEAMEDDEWRESVGDEIGAMIKNGTWFESELPKGKKAVTSRLLYTIKYGADGKPQRKKTM